MTLKGPFDPNRIAYNPQVDNRLLDENKPEEWHENNFTVKDAQAYQRLNSTQEHTELRGPTLRFYDDKISKEIYGVKQNKNYLKKKKKKSLLQGLICFVLEATRRDHFSGLLGSVAGAHDVSGLWLSCPVLTVLVLRVSPGLRSSVWNHVIC